jgi:peptide/nickel transport system ATP-binding protein
VTDRDGPVLEVTGLCTQFRLRGRSVTAVDDVSFTVAPGECVGIVGESGSGKSTAALSLTRLVPPPGRVTGGSVRLQGRDLATLDRRDLQRVRGNDIGMIFQDPMSALNPTMTIGRQIAEPVRLHRRVSAQQARRRALEVLDLVGVPHPAERLASYPHQLSGGLRQRVMIAIALACEPGLLVADEPTTALDVSIQAQILDLIDDLRERLSMAVILITHDLGVIGTRTDRVMVMYAGRFVEHAPTAELFSSLRHPYTEALLQAIPRLDHDRSELLYNIPGQPPDLSARPPGCAFHPRCRYATSSCQDEIPPLGPGDATAAEHEFACFHPVTGPPGSGERPAAVRRAGVTMPGVKVIERAAPHGGNAAPEPGGEDAVVRAESLVKVFRVSAGSLLPRRRTLHAVSGVSFTVARGHTLGLVGESGSGKTTVGRMVVALERPTSGRVVYDGTDLAGVGGAQMRRLRRDLQLMYQDPYASLDPRMTVGAAVREPLAIQKTGSAAQQRERVAELLAEVGLPSWATDAYPHEFSGGQRQRVGLARALALNPRVVVADEPVSALDVSVQAQILNLMRSIQERHQLTYMLISHDLSVVRYLADTIGVMYLGKLVEMAPADAIFTSPAHPYTWGLIETIPVPDPAARRTVRAGVRGELPSSISPPSGCRFRTRCPLAREICANTEPVLRAFGPGHLAACHFPLVTPVSAEAAGGHDSAPAEDHGGAGRRIDGGVR